MEGITGQCESMEEELLPRSTIDVEDIPPSGASSSATSVLVLSTMVALCGSMCTGCAVSTIALILIKWHVILWDNHFSYSLRVLHGVERERELKNNETNKQTVWLTHTSKRNYLMRWFYLPVSYALYPLTLGSTHLRDSYVMRGLYINRSYKIILYQFYFLLLITCHNNVLKNL